LDRVTGRYGQVLTIQDITLEVNSGELVGLVGANNAGKSTLLKTIVGLLKPTSGSILFEKEDLTNLAVHEIVERGISLIPEAKLVYPEMTVLDNLLIGSHTSKAKKERKATLERVYELFPVLERRRDQSANTLSGGEQRMLAIGRALMCRPKLLLVDEPSIGLGPLIIRNLYGILQQLTHQGIGVLVSDQNVTMLAEISPRVYVLSNGRILASGDGKELLRDKEVRKACMGWTN
jgi:branched-chain amino acid transport system ATP-binding protein